MGTTGARGSAGLFQGIAQLLSTVGETGEILTHMNHDRRLWGESQQSIKTGDAIGLSRWDGETLTDIVEGFRANPANTILDSMQGR